MRAHLLSRDTIRISTICKVAAWPVISTSYLLEHYITRHDFYGARNVVITSASSKTALGFGHFLTQGHKDKCHAIGLTSARNKAFVEMTGCYDEVLTYDEIDRLPSKPAWFLIWLETHNCAPPFIISLET